jgi:Protein of unknown function (DUF3443)
VPRLPAITLLTAVSLSVGLGCGGGSSTTPQPAAPVLNVLKIAVDGGPVPTQVYHNGAFTSVNICVPRTTTCQTIDGVLVDTGSYGLRLLQSLVYIPLPAVAASNGVPAQDCISSMDGSYLWGPVVTADIQIAGETASSASIHLISGSSSGIPKTCSNGGTDENTPQSLGANGVLGVGPEPVDCGSKCDPAGGLISPPATAYYTCSGSTCEPAFVSLHSQVVNPVVLFVTDNNGVILKLPSVSGTTGTLNGSMIFGIGTQSNNGLGSTKVYTLDASDTFTTDYGSQILTGSFIDSGSNALFFPDSTIPTCPTSPINLSSFFCPTSLLNLAATLVGANNATDSISFSVDNAQNLYSTGDAALSTLAGPNATDFDWGLPFFYGRNVYTAVRGQPMPTGAPAAPWWAF